MFKVSYRNNCVAAIISFMLLTQVMKQKKTNKLNIKKDFFQYEVNKITELCEKKSKKRSRV